MSWMIRISSTTFAQDMSSGAIPGDKFFVTSTPGHTLAQWRISPGSGKTTSRTTFSAAGSQAEQAWQNVLSALVGI